MLCYSGYSLFQDDAQVKDTRFIFVFALSNSADPEPGTGYSELRYLSKVVFTLVPNEYRIQPAVTKTMGLFPFCVQQEARILLRSGTKLEGSGAVQSVNCKAFSSTPQKPTSNQNLFSSSSLLKVIMCSSHE